VARSRIPWVWLAPLAVAAVAAAVRPWGEIATASLVWLGLVASVVLAARRGGWIGSLVAVGVGSGVVGAAVVGGGVLGGSGWAGSTAAVVAAATAMPVGLAIGWLAESLIRDPVLAQPFTAGALVVLDAEGRFRRVTPEAEGVLGYRPEELEGRALTEFTHPEEEDRVTRLVGAPGRPDSAITTELRFRGPGDEWRAIELVGRNLLSDRRVRGVVACLRDITERRRVEEQLRLSQRMQAVGRLAAGTAHDFNNVLTSLQGHVELLLRHLRPDDPLRIDVEGIKQAADRATTLTQQLLAFSRQQVLQPRVMDLSAIVAELEPKLRKLLGEKIEVVMGLDRRSAWVKADPTQIEQVLMNLAENARDAMPEGGRVTIQTASVEIDEAFARKYRYHVETGRYTLLRVSDNGHGMDEATVARIFEPFFTTKGPGKGTGLGLSAVYGIVKQSGGYIWVDSEPERGTTVSIYLPALAEAELERRPVVEPRVTGSGGGATVLVVEDDEMVRSIVRRVLLQDGYSILEAHHGRDAIWMSEGYPYTINLLLTDIVMPEMSGRELARHLAAKRPGLRILYMSGHTDEAIMAPSVFERGTAFIQKPFTPDALARKVQEVLGATVS